METLSIKERALRRLRVVRWVALLDALLLVALVFASVTGRRAWVSVLGPLHGANFLLLLTVIGTAAVDGLWRWWFPALTFITGGPLGTFIGEWLVRRQLAREA